MIAHVDAMLAMASCGSFGKINCMLRFKGKIFTINFSLGRKHSTLLNSTFTQRRKAEAAGTARTFYIGRF